MILRTVSTIISCLIAVIAMAADQDVRPTIDLNGPWEFEQTNVADFPNTYTRRVPVPGLVFLAQPQIDQCDRYFKVGDAATYEFCDLTPELLEKQVTGP